MILTPYSRKSSLDQRPASESAAAITAVENEAEVPAHSNLDQRAITFQTAIASIVTDANLTAQGVEGTDVGGKCKALIESLASEPPAFQFAMLDQLVAATEHLINADDNSTDAMAAYATVNDALDEHIRPAVSSLFFAEPDVGGYLTRQQDMLAKLARLIEPRAVSLSDWTRPTRCNGALGALPGHLMKPSLLPLLDAKSLSSFSAVSKPLHAIAASDSRQKFAPLKTLVTAYETACVRYFPSTTFGFLHRCHVGFSFAVTGIDTTPPQYVRARNALGNELERLVATEPALAGVREALDWLDARCQKGPLTHDLSTMPEFGRQRIENMPNDAPGSYRQLRREILLLELGSVAALAMHFPDLALD
ncbi:MAG: hypothetical protein V4669_04250 [Pseudomonadota bacterium]